MLLESTALPLLIQYIESLRLKPGEVVMLLYGEQDTPDIPVLVEALNQRNITFFGGVFPGLLFADKRLSGGCIVKQFSALLKPFCVTQITDAKLSGLPPFGSIALDKNGTAIVLFDGLSPNLYHFLENLNDLLGMQCDFIGGGAGSISLQQQACIFSNAGFMEDAAVVCVVDNRVRLGVRHGWEKLAGPLVATQAEGNTILELNWQKAIDVYNHIVEKDRGIKLDQDNFASIAQGYPFGILREMADDIVRDPLSMSENGAIVCIGEVPPNTVLHVLKGRPEALLQAARQAIHECGGGSEVPIRAKGTFVVDCITRTLFLDEQFADEMNIIRSGMTIDSNEEEPYGVLSLGELASYGVGLLELFNKTVVIGSFH